MTRLADNEAKLINVCKLLVSVVTAKRQITPAGGWLLDNFYLIEEQIRTAKRHLPKGYSRELPRLANGPSAGRPRVYDIALEIISHGDGRVDMETLGRFMVAYQSVNELKLGELWAIPIMLRLAVIENLRRVGMRIAAGRAERNLADSWADQMTEIAEKDPKSLILVIADMARSDPVMGSAFVAELARRLQGRGPALALPLTWIEQRLSESGQTIEHLVQSENQQQAANQVSVSNSIGSLRVLGTTDWRTFVESMSVVEQALLLDPAGIYGAMDFMTRDRYRHAIETIAKQGKLSEGGLARLAIAMARNDANQGSDTTRYSQHVGYYLVDQGLPALESKAQAPPGIVRSIGRVAGRHPLLPYLGSILLISLLLSATLVVQWYATGAPAWLLGPLGLITLLVSSQLVITLVNWLSSLLVEPKPLPRMDYDHGIPPRARTLVVVPTLLTSAANVEELVEALEVRFLANRDTHLHFGLLTDFLDAARETLAEDAPLLELAQMRIVALNEKYGGDQVPPRSDIFFLLHRPRLWNPQEQTWMGRERKRGKLEDLNALLRDTQGKAKAHFSLLVGDITILTSVKYVITLDTDTQLPRDAARQFIGAMAHPLNHPHYDPQRRCITAGYGILQPSVAISLPGTNRSRFARLYGGEPGIDPYTRTVSDVYQDVFGEGSFIGKGIYDVDALEQTLSGSFPDNRLLSHDLLEGCYARSGLLSDVSLYEDYPASYHADVSRRHRWIRGDWQLAGWLWRQVPTAGTGTNRRGSPLSALSQWKLLDNLRRSLVPIALLLFLLVGWTLPSAGLWTMVAVGMLLAPTLLSGLVDLFRRPDEVLLRQQLSIIYQAAARHVLQVLFELACLPYQAYYSLDAILRTLWRTAFSHRRLLEWNPSSETDREAASSKRNTLTASFRLMAIGPAMAVGIAVYVLTFNPMALPFALPLLLLWLASPAMAWWISHPLIRRIANLTAAQRQFLRVLARRTWAFFDTFVGPADHWLPPDNYQEYRTSAVAHRTSPTNIGLALLANLTAYDFGYLTCRKLLERTDNTLRTMSGMEQYRNHFYNWYDTQTLQPLPPLYISTVDSGNLAGHLLTLRSGLLALTSEPILSAQTFDGLSDTYSLLAEPAKRFSAEALDAFRQGLASAAAMPFNSLADLHLALIQLCRCANDLSLQIAQHAEGNGTSAASHAAKQLEASAWAQTLITQCHEELDDLTFLAPWLLLPSAPEELRTLIGCDKMTNLHQLAQLDAELDSRMVQWQAPVASQTLHAWLADFQRAVVQGSQRARERLATLTALASTAAKLARMDYEFLFDKRNQLLSIGYNVAEHRMDASYYDLLASEARLGSFVAIAQSQIPQENWFALGRLLATSAGGEPVLMSWSGSMFEYLMPLLVMPTYDHTLLDQTYKAAVTRQIEYGRQCNVPWGISESGYNTVDGYFNYQYRAFGVPGLGLKRGLAEDLVIAPYASALALMVAPEAACLNLQRLSAEGYIGKFGCFEAIDYTPARQRRGESRALVRSYLAHHQGMVLLSLAYELLNRPMQRRFEADPELQAVMLLLQEKVPRPTALLSHRSHSFDGRFTAVAAETPIRLFHNPDTSAPEVQLLSNGRYHVMVSNSGGGYSRWKDLAVTRWREDGTCDNWGTFCYIRDITSGSYWSTSHQPTLVRPQQFEAIFSERRAEFRRRDSVGSSDAQLETYTEIVVSPEDDVELRRTKITNRTDMRRQIDITSYAEVVIAPAAADALHQAFSNLFVQTEIIPERHAILCTRRSRSLSEQAPWMLHLMAVHGVDTDAVSYETDRSRFIGRNRTGVAPAAMRDKTSLSGSAGSVLDPIVAIRCMVTLDPDQSVTLDVVSGMAETRELAMGLIDKYQDRHLADRVFDLAWTHSQVVLQQINASETDAQLHARLASSVIYANASLRADPTILIQNRRGQSGLWGYAISGDLPIVLLQITDAANIELVRQLVQAHAYWRLKGLAVDLVIWNEDHAAYRQRLQEQIIGMIASGIEANVIDRPGGIFVRPAEQISGEDRILFQAVARIVISDTRGTLLEQLDHRNLAEQRPPLLLPSRSIKVEKANEEAPPHRELILRNGLGGFTTDGREYVMTLAPDQVTPAPWVNVLANPQFGTVISESGAAYTWGENAHEFRLTPWHNDPVSDGCGEAIYLRDEETGQVWSPTPLPAHAGTSYVVRHGFGYSVFETQVGGIRSELWVYVAMDAAVKFSVLKLRNESGRPRKLSATTYVEWLLGDLRARTAMHLCTEVAIQNGALYARNPYSTEFADRIGFLDVDDPSRSVSGDRVEFLGRNGTMRNPAGLRRTRLSGKVGAGLDPCGAMQVQIELAEGQAREIVFRLGMASNLADAGALVQRFRGVFAARTALEKVWQHWRETLGAVQVETPEPAFDVLVNGWLPYQTLACRLWARSGYYQSGGAFGFRDQLQDVAALVHTAPGLARDHLLRCAGRQFLEGDVQHWWHPPAGRGVRTHCSDDYLWLPLVVCRYVTTTGDTGVLDEPVGFLEGRPVNPGDDSYYDLPGHSTEIASLYEHCVRAIRHGLNMGQHGLPLMGSGDWNDGMNLVGIDGRGESIWLGFFLYNVLRQFGALATQRGDPDFAALCETEAIRLGQNIEQHGWDGAWYRRAYFDDGRPLGSVGNTECRIDSISQSWAVMSGAGDAARAREGMDAVYLHLVRPQDGLVQLLTPPFNTSDLDPGYIRGYVPGVRENGGQYTHGAIWAAMAYAALGDQERAWELLAIINPLNRTATAESAAIYKVEPYVMAADVYALAPHVGRGGWSWYTGSAGWMYRLMVESLLGLRRTGETLTFAPCPNRNWPSFKLHYRYRDTLYHITVLQDVTDTTHPNGMQRLTVDGATQDDQVVALRDDKVDHYVVVIAYLNLDSSLT
ncbi:GH36-type glycosyl hydrolase domain-containing protein [Chitinimonas naiadis]